MKNLVLGELQRALKSRLVWAACAILLVGGALFADPVLFEKTAFPPDLVAGVQSVLAVEAESRGSVFLLVALMALAVLFGTRVSRGLMNRGQVPVRKVNGA